MSRPPITCHILDTTRGKPAANVQCTILYLSGLPTSDVAALDPFTIGTAHTNADGRVARWEFPAERDPRLTALGIKGDEWTTLHPGVYKITFLTALYFGALDGPPQSNRTFFPFVEISFIVDNPPDAHYHVPVLLANHSYSTYRGS